MLAESHLLQFNEFKQVTHPIPIVILHVYPDAQHPCERLGRKEKPDLQDAHWFAISHRSQLRLEEQEMHPTPGVALRVNYVMHIEQVLAISHRIQFKEDGHSTHE